MSAPKWLRALGIPELCIARESSAGLPRERSFSIHRQPGDRIWRVQVDGCWLIGSDKKRVDYLFWGQSAAGRKAILLVELKGKRFGDAFQQIECTLEWLCKRAGGGGIHTGIHRDSPGHDPIGGVRAYVVLSEGEEVSLRQPVCERLRQKYGVLVYPKTRRLEINGLDALP